jgi:hypothetical protein
MGNYFLLLPPTGATEMDPPLTMFQTCEDIFSVDKMQGQETILMQEVDMRLTEVIPVTMSGATKRTQCNSITIITEHLLKELAADLESIKE